MPFSSPLSALGGVDIIAPLIVTNEFGALFLAQAAGVVVALEKDVAFFDEAPERPIKDFRAPIFSRHLATQLGNRHWGAWACFPQGLLDHAADFLLGSRR